MRKTLFTFIIILFSFILIGCSEDTEHTHKFKESIIEPTCTEEGYTLYKCECGESNKDNKKAALGHIEEKVYGKSPTSTENGLSDGLKCSRCNIVLKEQQVIPALGEDTSTVSFSNLKGAKFYENYTYDNNNNFLLDSLGEPTIKGYVFEGWFTSKDGGERVDYISAGDKKNYVLFAQWNPIEYEIKYIDAPINNNPTSYNIETTIMLDDPEWFGLIFSHWVDSNDNVVETIEAGTTGYIELTAHWIDSKNYSVQADENNRFETEIYDEASGTYYLVYELGTIYNVELGIIDSRKKSDGIPVTINNTKEISYDEECTKKVSETTRSVVTKTKGWSEAKGFADELSVSISGGRKQSVSAGISNGYAGIGAAIERAIGFNISNDTTWTKSESNSTEEMTTEEKNKTVESTVSYKKTVKETISIEQELTNEIPSGTYSYVYSGTVYVFAIVIFDANEGNYYLNILSVLDEEISEGFLYKPDGAKEVNIKTKDALDYNIPIEEIKNDYCYVKYDANDGQGTMPMSLIKVGETKQLHANTFTNHESLAFRGWQTDKNGNIDYEDCENVCDITNGGGIVTLYAKWGKKDGSISYKVSNEVYDIDYYDYGTITQNPVQNPSINGLTFKGWKFYNAVTNEVTEFSIGNEMPKYNLIAVSQWEASHVVQKLHSGKENSARHKIAKWSSWGNDVDSCGIDIIYPNFNRDLLIELGYTKISVSMTFYYKVDDWGDQMIQIFSHKDKEVKAFTYEWEECGWSQKTEFFELDLNTDVQTDGSFWIKWYLSKDGYNSDTWFVGETTFNMILK